MVGRITGKVLDEDKDTIPYATVFISDKNGKLINENSRVKTDLDGNFSLPISQPYGDYIKVMANTYPVKVMPIPKDFYSKGQSEVGSVDITLDINTQLLPEFTVYGSKPNWIKKNKWWLIGGGALLATVATILIIKKRKK